MDVIKSKIAILLLIICPLLSFSVHYKPEYSKAHWHVTKSPLLCQISQDIPGYGRAIFSQQNGRRLKFTLRHWFGNDMANLPVSLYRKGTDWADDTRANALTKTYLQTGFSVVKLNDQMAYKMLMRLSKGESLRFKYQPMPRETIRVDLLPIKFKNAMSQFNRCKIRLLPYQFKDVADSTLHFTPGSHFLSKSIRARLDRVVQYILADKKIERIRVEGHSDMDGTKSNNMYLSELRAKSVRAYLINNGVPTRKIKTIWYGPKKPIANNDTAMGRSQNRRVELYLDK